MTVSLYGEGGQGVKAAGAGFAGMELFFYEACQRRGNLDYPQYVILWNLGIATLRSQ